MQGKVIVIVGGGSGIGRAAALLCGERGAQVAVVDRRSEAAEAVADEIRSAGGIGRAYLCDISDDASVSRTFDAIGQEIGPVDGLFTAAAVDLGGFAHEMTTEHWNQVIAVNLNGTFFCCREAIRSMIESGRGGSIVTCSSPASFVAFSAGANSAYAASKGAVSSLTRTLAVDYARRGIRVNAIVPGATETPLFWMAAGDVDAETKSELRGLIAGEVPLGRLEEPKESALAAVWLLGDESSYVTGSHLVCDGGVLAKASVSF
jgi:NAD(P)-dependent dehydrogenase (short-subunit alcohol dehydrogenase family)